MCIERILERLYNLENICNFVYNSENIKSNVIKRKRFKEIIKYIQKINNEIKKEDLSEDQKNKNFKILKETKKKMKL